jgi:hypothetical protein
VIGRYLVRVTEAKMSSKRIYFDKITGQGWPSGGDIYYECTTCGDVLYSAPDEDSVCKCGNINIQVSSARFWAGEGATKMFHLIDCQPD